MNCRRVPGPEQKGKPLTDAFKALDALKANKKTKPSASDRAKKKPPGKAAKPRRRS